MPDSPGRARLWARLGTTIVISRLFAFYVAYAQLKHIVAVQTLARRAWQAPRRTPRRPSSAVLAPIVRLANLVGTERGDCVELALLCYRELSRAGFQPVLMLGLARRDGGGSEGHAWVELEGRPVIEPVDSVARFVPTAAFGAGGRQVPIERA